MAQIFERRLAVVVVLIHREVVQGRAHCDIIILVTPLALLGAIAAIAEGCAKGVGVVREHAAHVPNEWLVGHEHEFDVDAARSTVGAEFTG